jgi:ABC-2 type transport system permease protein
MLVYTLVFSNILIRQVEDFPIFLFIGITAWRAFQSSIMTSSNSIVGNGNLVKKIYFPRMILPISMVLVEIVNYLLTLPIVIAMIIISDTADFSRTFFLCLIILLIEMIFTMGLSLITAALTVFFRDLQHILSILLLVWFYMSGVIYPFEILPEKVKLFLSLNPMVHFILAFRDVMFYENPLNIQILIILFGISLLVLILGIKVFINLQDKFTHEL